MRNWKRNLIIPIVLLGAALPARADEHLPPVANETVRQECGACHMAYQPQFLPRESWRKIMGRLPRHFRHKVVLPEATRQEIELYLVANAADVSDSPEGRNFHDSIGKGVAPLRITHVPHWAAHHRGTAKQAVLTDPRVKSKADCLACHRAADTGLYDGN